MSQAQPQPQQSQTQQQKQPTKNIWIKGKHDNEFNAPLTQVKIHEPDLYEIVKGLKDEGDRVKVENIEYLLEYKSKIGWQITKFVNPSTTLPIETIIETAKDAVTISISKDTEEYKRYIRVMKDQISILTTIKKQIDALIVTSQVAINQECGV